MSYSGSAGVPPAHHCMRAGRSRSQGTGNFLHGSG
jgi:hypothetical protein